MKLPLLLASTVVCASGCLAGTATVLIGPEAMAAKARGSALRSVMNVAAVGSGTRTLFGGHGDIASSYSVDRTDDVVISFGEGVKDLQGSISVRARILGPTPTEVPVENYTVVNDKELKEERKLLMADDTDFFRDPAHRKLVERVGELQRFTTEYRGLLESTALMGLRSLYGEDDVKSWFAGASLPAAFSRQPDSAAVTTAVALVRRSLDDEATARVKALLQSIDQVQADINTLFLASDLASQLTDGGLSLMQSETLGLISTLTELRARLDTTLAADATTLDACATKFTGYLVKQEVVAKDDKGADVKLPANEYFRVDNATLPRIVFPPVFEGLTVNIKAQLRALELVNVDDQDGYCYPRVIPSVVGRLRRQLETVLDLEKSLQDPPGSVLARIDAMKKAIRQGIEGRLLRDVRDARVKMSTLDLRHGDRLEIIVRVSRQGTTLRAGDSRSTIDLEERIVIRAVDQGVSFATSPQFVLIKRASDLRTPTTTESPSNFKPAAGVLFNMRLRTLNATLDWVIPSIGLAAHVADFDPANSLEIGIGPGIGLLDDHVHAGMGWDLSVNDNRRYWWVSLDFLRASETFSGLFGGGK